MAKSIKKPEPLTKAGPSAVYKRLQNTNDSLQLGFNPEVQDSLNKWSAMLGSSDFWNPLETAEREVMSPLRSMNTHTGKTDYWGRSMFDPKEPLNINEFSQISDMRAENQPWYSKIASGAGKMAVTAATSALEGWMLLPSAFMAMADGKWSTLWNNPITQALQSLNEWSEDAMPNYYTRDEQENPLHHMFNANWLGDGLIKNIGFMIGAFYGGIPYSYGIGKVGEAIVKGAREFDAARKAALAGKTATSAVESAEKVKRFKSGLDLVTSLGNNTRRVSSFVGSLASAVNEGMIEAINNSKDWANMATRKADDNYQKIVADILEDSTLSDADKDAQLQAAKQRYDQELAAIEDGKDAMGNADLALNLPILLTSNLFQFGKLYTRGFESNRRRIASLFTGYVTPGKIADGTLRSGRTKIGALLHAAARPQAEGLEEYLQRAASEGSGNAISEYLRRELDDNYSEESREYIRDMVVNFVDSALKNLGNQSAWNEYLIGAISGALGMPVFGSQTKNAWVKIGNVGLGGGFVGALNDYNDAKKKETDLSNYLNKRSKDPNFAKQMDYLAKTFRNDAEMLEALLTGDKERYKDLDFDQLFEDINAAASLGHYGELKAMWEHGGEEYSDEDLATIVDATKRPVVAAELRFRDALARATYQNRIEKITGTPIGEGQQISIGDMDTSELDAAEYASLEDDIDKYNMYNDRLEKKEYEDTEEGEYLVESDGRLKGMNETDPDGMRKKIREKRKTVLDLMDSILKIRDQVDMETDGRLDDTQLKVLTKLRANIDNIIEREMSMGSEFLDGLKTAMEDARIGETTSGEGYNKTVKELKDAQTAYEKAVKARESVEKAGGTDEEISEATTKEAETKRTLEEKKKDKAKFDFAMELMSSFLEKRDESLLEAAGRNYGNAENTEDKVLSFFRAIKDWTVGTKRDINIDEMEAFLSTEYRRSLLSAFINDSKTLTISEKAILKGYILDLHNIAKKKLEYRDKFNEYLGNIKSLERDIQDTKNKLSEKKKNNIVKELALQIKGATNLLELDRVMANIFRSNSDLAMAALAEAKKTGSEQLKKLIDKYEKLHHYYNEFTKFLMKYRSNIQSVVMGGLSESFKDALENTAGTLDDFKESLKKVVESLRNGSGQNVDTALANDAADAIEEVMESINKGAASVSTRDTAKNTTDSSPSTSSTDGKRVYRALSRKDLGNAILSAIKKRLKTAVEEGKELPAFTTLESLKALEGLNGDETLYDTVEKFNADITSTNKLTDKTIENTYKNALKKLEEDKNASIRSKRGETEVKEEPEEITPIDADDLADDDNANYDLDEESDQQMYSEVAAGIRRRLLAEFTSDAVSQFLYGEDHKEEWNIPETNPLRDWYEKIRRILNDYGAYDFVNRGFLGALWMDNKDLPIHFLRSTDSDLLGNRPATFLAIEDPESGIIPETIARVFYKNNKAKAKSALEKFGTVEIDGKHYFIVGCLSYAMPKGRKVDEDESLTQLIEAFNNLQNAITQSCEKDLKAEQEKKDNGETPASFVLDKNHSTTIGSINTGRLVLRNDTDKDPSQAINKISLEDFLADSEEWQNGMEVEFGVIANDAFQTRENSLSGQEDRVQSLNDKYLVRNNGAVFILARKPNGKLYPLRCTKKTLKDFLDEIFPPKEGSDEVNVSLEDIKELKKKNTYYREFFKALETAFDARRTEADRKQACKDIYRFLPTDSGRLYVLSDGDLEFASNEAGNEISEYFETKDNKTDNDVLDGILSFLNYLVENPIKGKKVKVSLPSPTTDLGERIIGRDVVTANIFTIGIKNYHNFNANFTVIPIDADGKTVTMAVSDVEAIPARPRPVEREWDLGFGGLKTYRIDMSSTKQKVQYKEGSVYKDVSEAESNAVIAVFKAIDAKAGTTGAIGLDKIFDSSYMEQLNEAFNDVVVIDIVDDEGNIVYYVHSGNRLFKYGIKDNSTSDITLTDAGKDLYNKLTEANKNLVFRSKGRRGKNASASSSVVEETVEEGGTDPVTVIKQGTDFPIEDGGNTDYAFDRTIDSLTDEETDQILQTLNNHKRREKEKVEDILSLLHNAEKNGYDFEDEDSYSNVFDMMQDYLYDPDDPQDNQARAALEQELKCKRP